MACSRAGAGPGHGRLGATLRVVAAVLHAGEAAPPRDRRVPRSARPAPAPPAPRARSHPGRVDARAQGGARVRAHACASHLGDCPRGRAPRKTPRRGADRGPALPPFTAGETEAGKRNGRSGEAWFGFGVAPAVGAAPSLPGLSELRVCSGGVPMRVPRGHHSFPRGWAVRSSSLAPGGLTYLGAGRGPAKEKICLRC